MKIKGGKLVKANDFWYNGGDERWDHNAEELWPKGDGIISVSGIIRCDHAKTNCAVAAAAKVNLDEGFVYNKDAHMLQCPAGHLAMRERKRIGESGNTHYTYAFSKKKCRGCPLWDTCPVHKGTEYTYSYTEPNQDHRARLEFENSEEFNKKLEVRHRIEEKNGEMKTAHGFQRADSVGMVAMRLQAYLTAIVVNMKRIVAAISV